jgi:hypothetical protein
LAAPRHPNATAVRALVRALAGEDKLDSKLKTVAALATTSAGLIDAAVAKGERAYALANLLRAHNAILVTLIGLTVAEQGGEFDELIDALRSPVGYGPMGDAIVGGQIPDELPPWITDDDRG